MPVQRAVVKATAFGIVQVRNMYTAEVVTSGGDTAQLLWETYLDMLYGSLISQLAAGFVAYSTELQNYSAGQWVTFDELASSYTGTSGGEPLPNAVSMVLIGKASGLRHVGRKFFGPITEISNMGNVIPPGVMAVLATVLLNYVSPVTGIGGGTLTPGIVDKVGTFHPFVGGIVSSLLGSMRRRKPGLGI